MMARVGILFCSDKYEPGNITQHRLIAHGIGDCCWGARVCVFSMRVRGQNNGKPLGTAFPHRWHGSTVQLNAPRASSISDAQHIYHQTQRRTASWAKKKKKPLWTFHIIVESNWRRQPWCWLSRSRDEREILTKIFSIQCRSQATKFISMVIWSALIFWYLALSRCCWLFAWLQIHTHININTLYRNERRTGPWHFIHIYSYFSQTVIERPHSTSYNDIDQFGCAVLCWWHYNMDQTESYTSCVLYGCWILFVHK